MSYHSVVFVIKNNAGKQKGDLIFGKEVRLTRVTQTAQDKRRPPNPQNGDRDRTLNRNS